MQQLIIWCPDCRTPIKMDATPIPRERGAHQRNQPEFRRVWCPNCYGRITTQWNMEQFTYGRGLVLQEIAYQGSEDATDEEVPEGTKFTPTPPLPCPEGLKQLVKCPWCQNNAFIRNIATGFDAEGTIYRCYRVTCMCQESPPKFEIYHCLEDAEGSIHVSIPEEFEGGRDYQSVPSNPNGIE